jgi:thiamine-phosphate pyrophosphorylase
MAPISDPAPILEPLGFASLAEALRLTLVVSRGEAAPRSVEELADLAFRGGVTALQLREKLAPDREVWRLARDLARFCRERGRLLIVDDRVDVALAAGAHGVHVGQSDLPARAVASIIPKSMILGVSVSTEAQAGAALAAGADYLGVGAMVATGSKTDAAVVPEAEAAAINSLGAVTVAIGGVGEANAARFRAMGFQGLAVISALTRSADPEATARILAG